MCRAGLFIASCILSINLFGQAPTNFAMLDSLPEIVMEYRYFSGNNFVGQPIEGYHARKMLATEATYQALKEAQLHLQKQGLGLKIFDAYRPQPAVNHFVRWAQDLSDTATKQEYYPNVPKDELFKRGYIAAKSGHSRGSTVDITLVDLKTGTELDMGTPFDFFGKESWPFSNKVSESQRQNRLLLREVMMKFGFEPLPTEWWHFTLKNEPYPNTYFEFIIR